MTRTDTECQRLTAAVNAARRIAYAEAGRIGLAQVLLALEGETKALRDYLRSTREQPQPQYPVCEE